MKVFLPVPSTHVGVQLSLVLSSVLLLLRRSLSGGLPLGLLNVLLPLLLPLLQLALADIFASDLVEESLGLGLVGLGLVGGGGGGGAVRDSGVLQLVGDLLDTVLDGIDYSLGRHGVVWFSGCGEKMSCDHGDQLIVLLGEGQACESFEFQWRQISGDAGNRCSRSSRYRLITANSGMTAWSDIADTTPAHWHHMNN